MTPSPAKNRFSREEFLNLMAMQLDTLEGRQDAQRQYGPVLAALRFHLEAYKQSQLKRR
ncbi:hypothetical protein [Hymenobacter sp. BT491]|uniref:hypothetical protein n=1 Tax=Hymenobacter sp. BT491 TaxID=2766779 RepID=UPI001653AF88|nr:hypothetical protein [Hymenobacter sp. BT491]MBC6989291.1 hypothetical protein [Hymenobacter sp. BT491]